ncbi:UNVERIFIED_CONTAM: hypothetical protein GTU68_018959 [Idotea baltica]|nr:hypothetical protein [Idotea baltica]
MAKKVDALIKLQVPAGGANPSPPVGPALGQHGVNIMEFCKAFNAATGEMEKGLPVPVVITVYADKSFTYIMKTPPASVLLLKAAGIKKGSGVPHTDKVGKVTRAQLEEIATAKMADLNAYDIDQAVKIIAGSARSMGIETEGGDNVAKAKEAGADIVGMDDLAEQVKNGDMDFDIVIASPDAMRVVGQLGQILGPKGLMPNPKTGTVAADVATAVKNAKAGQVQFRIDKAGIIQCTVGKASFSAEDLQTNFEALVTALQKAKPSSAKGQYFKRVSVSTTMGPGIRVDRATLPQF